MSFLRVLLRTSLGKMFNRDICFVLRECGSLKTHERVLCEWEFCLTVKGTSKQYSPVYVITTPIFIFSVDVGVWGVCRWVFI